MLAHLRVDHADSRHPALSSRAPSRTGPQVQFWLREGDFECAVLNGWPLKPLPVCQASTYNDPSGDMKYLALLILVAWKSSRLLSDSAARASLPEAGAKLRSEGQLLSDLARANSLGPAAAREEGHSSF